MAIIKKIKFRLIVKLNFKPYLELELEKSNYEIRKKINLNYSKSLKARDLYLI